MALAHCEITPELAVSYGCMPYEIEVHIAIHVTTLFEPRLIKLNCLMVHLSLEQGWYIKMMLQAE